MYTPRDINAFSLLASNRAAVDEVKEAVDQQCRLLHKHPLTDTAADTADHRSRSPSDSFASEMERKNSNE